MGTTLNRQSLFTKENVFMESISFCHEYNVGSTLSVAAWVWIPSLKKNKNKLYSPEDNVFNFLMIYSMSLYKEKYIPKYSKVNLKLLYDLDTCLSYGLDIKNGKINPLRACSCKILFVGDDHIKSDSQMSEVKWQKFFGAKLFLQNKCDWPAVFLIFSGTSVQSAPLHQTRCSFPF